MNVILTILILFVMLSLIIGIHEFGHFIIAKKNGVYVDEFSLGMGPAIIKHKPKNSETTYVIRLFPVGGFVSMAEKEDPDNKEIKLDRVLENKGFFQKFAVLIAGIVMNCILAIVLFFISGLIYGKPINEPIVKSVVEGKAAALAGSVSINIRRTDILCPVRFCRFCQKERMQQRGRWFRLPCTISAGMRRTGISGF